MTAKTATLPARAFTLVEILISMLIFSVLIGALYAVLFSALRLRETTFRNVESGLPRDQVSALIRRDVENAVAPGGTLAGPLFGQPDVSGSGSSTSSRSGSGLATLNLGSLNIGASSSVGESSTPTETGLGNPADEYLLTFYTTGGAVRENDPWGDIQEVQYSLEDPADRSAQGKDLVRTVTRNLMTQAPADTGADGSSTEGTTTNVFVKGKSALDGKTTGGLVDETQAITETRLFSGVNSIQILFWDSVNKEWTDSWDSAAVAAAIADAAASDAAASTGATATATESTSTAAETYVNPTAIEIIIDFVNADGNAHFEKPLDLVIPIHAQPRPAPAATPAPAGGA